jgi:hypothetical protein
MFSNKKLKILNFATLILASYLIGIAVMLVSPVAFAQKPALKIREFKYYREIKYLERTIFINKKSLEVLLIKDKKAIKLLRDKYSKTFAYSSIDKDKMHHLVASFYPKMKPKIGYFSTNHITQYQESICIDEHAYNENLKKILDPALIKKIQSLEVTNLFDRDSCGSLSKDAQDEFKDALVESLAAKTSELKACAESDEAQKIFLKDTSLKHNALEVFGKYFSLVEGLQSAGIKFKCGLKNGETNKVASFSQNPLEIALNIVDKKFNLNIKNVSSTIDHELIHYGMSQFKDKPNSACIEEGFVQLFQSVCKFKPGKGMKVPPESSKIVDQCITKGKIDIKMDSATGAEFIFDGVPPLAAGTIAAAALEDKEQAKEMTQAIVAAVNSNAVAFEPVSDTIVQFAANAPVITATGNTISSFEGDGEFHQIIEGPSFSASVQQLGQSLSRSLDNADHLIASSLGNVGLVAAAAVGTQAVAKTAAPTTAKYAPLTLTEAFANRYYPDSPSVQAAMSNPKLDTMTYDQKESYYRSLGGSAGEKSDTTRLASGAVENSNSGDVKGSSAAAGSLKDSRSVVNSAQNLAASGGSRSVASLPIRKENESVNATENEEGAKKPQNESARVEQANQSAPVPINSNIKLDNAIIQRLTAFSKVNEPVYTRVTERFNDQTFRQQLDARRIRIFGENNKPLWASSVQPQRCFRDNKTTKVLEVVACK